MGFEADEAVAPAHVVLVDGDLGALDAAELLEGGVQISVGPVQILETLHKEGGLPALAQRGRRWLEELLGVLEHSAYLVPDPGVPEVLQGLSD